MIVNLFLDTPVIRWHIRTLTKRGTHFFGPEMKRNSCIRLNDQRATALVGSHALPMFAGDEDRFASGSVTTG